MGTTSKLLFLFATLITAFCQGFDQETCSNNDASFCSTIIINQLTLETVKGGVHMLTESLTSQILENHAEVMEIMAMIRNEEEEKANFAELATCRSQVTEKTLHVSDLKNRNKNATEFYTARQNEKEQLKQEVENLRKNNVDLREEINHLKENIPLQKKKIEALAVVAHKPMDCADWQFKGERRSGVYAIHPYQTDETVDVQCDFDSDGGAWTVFLNRQVQEVQVDFDLNWEEYKNGFGNARTEYWLGNDYIHALTSYGPSSLRTEAANFEDDHRWAQWNDFFVDSEENEYKMTASEYDSASTLGDSLRSSSNSNFTTPDRDNDISRFKNCAVGSRYSPFGRGGWWYSRCGNARPTAPLGNTNDWKSAVWKTWNPSDVKSKKITNLKSISMKIRRKNFNELTSVRRSS